MSYNEGENTYMFVAMETRYERYFPYIIVYYSPSFLQSFLQMEMKKNGIKISPEQLIGLVCGVTSVFFLILALIIFIIKKKMFIQVSDDLYMSYDDYSDDVVIESIINNIENSSL